MSKKSAAGDEGSFIDFHLTDIPLDARATHDVPGPWSAYIHSIVNEVKRRQLFSV